MQALLAIAPRPQKGAQPFGAASHLLAIADIPVGIEGGEIDLGMPRTMRAVDQQRHLGLAADFAISAIGSISALGEVMWSMMAILRARISASAKRLTKALMSGAGNGSSTSTTRAPERCAT